MIMNKREKNIWLRLIDKKIHETCGGYEGIREKFGAYQSMFETPEAVQNIIFNTIFDIYARDISTLTSNVARVIATLAFNDSKFIRKLPDCTFFPRECLVYEDEEEKQRSINEQLAWRAKYRSNEPPLIIENWHKEYKSFNELFLNYYEDIYTQKALDMAKDSKEFAKFSNTTKESLKLLKYRIAIAKSIYDENNKKYVRDFNAERTDSCSPRPIYTSSRPIEYTSKEKAFNETVSAQSELADKFGQMKDDGKRVTTGQDEVTIGYSEEKKDPNLTDWIEKEKKETDPSNDAEAKFVKHECTDCCHPWPLHEDKDL